MYEFMRKIILILIFLCRYPGRSKTTYINLQIINLPLVAVVCYMFGSPSLSYCCSVCLFVAVVKLLSCWCLIFDNDLKMIGVFKLQYSCLNDCNSI